MKKIFRLHSSDPTIGGKPELYESLIGDLDHEVGDKLGLVGFLRQNQQELVDWLLEDSENIVIVIDDNPDFRKLAERLLTKSISGSVTGNRILLLTGGETIDEIQALVEAEVIKPFKFTIITDYHLTKDPEKRESYTTETFLNERLFPIIAPEA